MIEIDEQGRVNLTLKGLPENEHLWKEGKGKQEMNGGFGGGRPSFGDRARFGNERGGRPERHGGFRR